MELRKQIIPPFRLRIILLNELIMFLSQTLKWILEIDATKWKFGYEVPKNNNHEHTTQLDESSESNK